MLLDDHVNSFRNINNLFIIEMHACGILEALFTKIFLGKSTSLLNLSSKCIKVNQLGKIAAEVKLILLNIDELQ